MAPETPGLTIVHHQGVLPEAPADTEGDRLALVCRPDIHDAREAEGSPGHGNGQPPDPIIRDLVVIELP